jgi:hypothetical protein
MSDSKKSADKTFDMAELAAIMTEVNEKCRKVVEKFVEKQQQFKGIDEAEAKSVRDSFQELTTRLMADRTNCSISKCRIGTTTGG